MGRLSGGPCDHDSIRRQYRLVTDVVIYTIDRNLVDCTDIQSVTHRCMSRCIDLVVRHQENDSPPKEQRVGRTHKCAGHHTNKLNLTMQVVAVTARAIYMGVGLLLLLHTKRLDIV